MHGQSSNCIWSHSQLPGGRSPLSKDSQVSQWCLGPNITFPVVSRGTACWRPAEISTGRALARVLVQSSGSHVTLLTALSAPTCCSLRWGTFSGIFRRALTLLHGAFPGAATWNSSLGVTSSRWHHRLFWIQSLSQEDKLVWKNFYWK